MPSSLEARGQWAAAEKEIPRLHNPILVGHLFARHYIDDAASARPDDLKAWLRHYSDLPEAQDIYALASRRLGAKFRAAGFAAPSHKADAAVDPDDADWTNFTIDSRAQRTAADRNRVVALKDTFRNKVSLG